MFLGSSRKDSKVVMEGRKEVSDKSPENEEEEVAEVTATVQQVATDCNSTVAGLYVSGFCNCRCGNPRAVEH